MGRAKTFDEGAAIAVATDLFWRAGYARTSTRDLAEAIGITGSSLYNAFGSKQALFASVLGRYAETSTRRRIGRIEEADAGIAAIEAFIEDVVLASASDRHRRGCLLVNSATDVAPHDGALGRAVAGYLDEIRQFFARNLRLAGVGAKGQGSASVDDLAECLMGVLLGIRCMARLDPDPGRLRAMAAPVLGLARDAAGTASTGPAPC